MNSSANPAPDVRNATWFDRDAYPFESRYLELPSGRMHYLDEGQGPALVFVHGSPGWSWDFRKLISGLRGRFRCIAPDHVGFGLSDRPRSRGLEVLEHTENLGRLPNALGIERQSLIVYDFGGPIALLLAIESPDRVARLVILNSWFWSMSIEPSFARAKRLAGSVLMRCLYLHANFSARVMVKASWGSHAPLDSRAHRHFTALFPDRVSRLGTWALARSILDDRAVSEESTHALATLRDLPSLVVWGQADRFVGKLHLERWKQELPAAHVVELPNVGHFPQDGAGDRVLSEIELFLAR